MANTKRITVSQLERKAGGRAKNGNEWTLYEVAALDEAGEPITQTLKTFEALPTGQLIEVEVEVQRHEKYGTSYLLTHVNRPKGLKGQVDWLTERLGYLESLMLHHGIEIPDPIDPAAAAQATAAANPDDVAV